MSVKVSSKPLGMSSTDAVYPTVTDWVAHLKLVVTAMSDYRASRNLIFQWANGVASSSNLILDTRAFWCQTNLYQGS